LPFNIDYNDVLIIIENKFKSNLLSSRADHVELYNSLLSNKE